MASSGTYDFSLSGGEIVFEALSRCKIRSGAVSRTHLIEARRSINLELIEWRNRGVDLYNVYPFTIQLVSGQAVYTQGSGPSNIPPQAVAMLDVYYSIINGGGQGINTDRIMIPMSRDEYAEFSNKLQPGQPTMYWFQKQPTRQMTIYQPSLQAYPQVQLGGYYLARIQDANIGDGQGVDVDILGQDALCAKLAYRLAVKFVENNENLVNRLKADGMEAWTLYAETAREDAPITILPQWGYGGGYGGI